MSNCRSGGHAGEQITLHEFDSFGHVMLRCILSRDLQCRNADIDRRQLAVRSMFCHADRDGAAAGSDIGDLNWPIIGSPLLDRVEHRDDHEFGLRTRNQHGGGDEKRQRKELAATNEIRDRLTGSAALDEFAELRPDRFGRLFFKRRVQLNALTTASLRQEHLGVESRAG